MSVVFARREAARREKHPDYHHCSCMFYREHAGKKGWSLDGTGRRKRITFKAPDCGFCDNTGWII